MIENNRKRGRVRPIKNSFNNINPSKLSAITFLFAIKLIDFFSSLVTVYIIFKMEGVALLRSGLYNLVQTGPGSDPEGQNGVGVRIKIIECEKNLELVRRVSWEVFLHTHKT